MARAQSVVTSATAGIRRSAGVAERSVQSFWGSAGGSSFRPYSLIAVSRAFDNASDRAGLLRGSLLATTAVFGGFAAALSSNLILRYADSYTKLINQLRVVSTSSSDATARFRALEEVSTRSRSSLEATAILYSRLQKAAPDRSADQVLAYVETIQKALALGGATAQEARSAAIQFSQAIASNRLGGDELRAILETPLGLALAKGLGVTIGKFREMGQSGQLTSSKVLGALQKIEGEVNGQFSKSILTLDQAIIHVDNSFTSVIGKLNKAYGGTSLLAQGIVALGDNFDTLIPTLTSVLGLLSAVFIARNKGLASSLAGGAIGAVLGNQIGGLTGALLGGGIGAIVARGAPNLIAGITENSKAAVDSVRTLRGQVSDLRKEFLTAADARRVALVGAKGNPIDAARPSLQSALLRASVNPNASITDINNAKAAAAADGQKRLALAVTQTTERYKFYGQELIRTNVQLGAATRATTMLAQAKQFLGRQLTSIVGLFGGPWGLAITAAIVGLGFLAENARKSANEIAAAEESMRQRINKLGDAGNDLAKSSIRDDLIEQLKAEQEGYDGLLASVKEQARLAGGGFHIEGFEAMGQKVDGLIDQLASGSISLEAFRAQLAEIGPGSQNFDNVRAAIEKSIKKIVDIGLATKSLNDELEALRANTQDPFKIFFEASGPDDLQKVVTDTAEALGSINDDIQVAKLKAKGLTAEAEAQQIVNTAKSQGKTVSYELILTKVKELEVLNDEAAALKKVETATETLTQRLAALKAESQGAFLPDIDREVLKQAKGLKVAASELDRYVRAVQSGNLSSAPPQLIDLRDQLLYERAANSVQSIIEKYGDWSQIAPLAAAKQRELSIAVAEGAITTDQAKVAFADYLGQFAQYSYIDDFANAFGDLVRSGVDGWDSLKEGALSFLKRIRDLVVELLVIQPLIDALKGAMGAGAGGGIIGSITSFVGGLFGGGGAPGAPMDIRPAYARHGGGRVNASGLRRRVPPRAFAGAPRFHSGLAGREFKTVLELGEHVLTEKMANRTAGTITGLARMAASGGGGGGGGMPAIHIHEAPGQTTEVRRGNDNTLHIINRLKSEIASDISSNGVVGRAIGGTFQTSRRKR